MAYRLWNQISSIKYLKHGTIKPYSSLAGETSHTTLFKRNSQRYGGGLFQSAAPEHEAAAPALCHYSDSASLGAADSDSVKLGRFVRTAPGPISQSEASEVLLRDGVRERIKYGHPRVSTSARENYERARTLMTRYTLRDSSTVQAHEDKIRAIRREYTRRVSVARHQPRSLVPFCARDAEKFEREDFRPHKFAHGQFAHTPQAGWQVIEPGPIIEHERKVGLGRDTTGGKDHDQMSIVSDDDSVLSGTGGAVLPSPTTDSEMDKPTKLNVESEEREPTSHVSTSPHMTFQADKSKARSHIGYNFTKYTTTRQMSTFNGRAAIAVAPLSCGAINDMTLLQTRTMGHHKSKSKKKKKKMVKDCNALRATRKKKPYIHYGRWDKCECCPEMLPCGGTTYVPTYLFDCMVDNYPQQCPIDCLPPCEPPPPPEVPLCRPKPCPVYQKQTECKSAHCPKDCHYVPRRKLPPMPCGPCPCVEPFVPSKKPPLRIAKRRIYQCQEVCTEGCIHSCVDCVVTPKCLPPIIPGDCPCIEPKIRDVPPLKRLNLQAFQKQPECKSEDCPEVEPLKCIPRKKLPPIKSDCYCIEPEPLKPVRLVRLPPICVCPPPPDYSCLPEPCPPRADEYCKWEFPKKKLKNWWCPNCPMPKNKRKWCLIHTRGQEKKRKKHRRRRQLCQPSRGVHTAAAHAGGCSTTPPNLLGLTAHIRPLALHSPAMSCNTSARLFHTTSALPQGRGKKKKDCKVKSCEVNFCPDPCCPPRARMGCTYDVNFDCTKRHSPYPAFSECCEYAETLSCECGLQQRYLQPQHQVSEMQDVIQKPPMPKHKLINPVLEEQCVLKDLCRPYGHTYTCATFHEGEALPLTQYECLSPHRLPCCERDQICDFAKDAPCTTCEGRPKERTYYRCECACMRRQPKCSPEKMAEMKRLEKASKRKFSTFTGASKRIMAAAPGVPAGNVTVTLAAPMPPNVTSVRNKNDYATGGSGMDAGYKKCKKQCKWQDKNKQCGKPMRPSMMPGVLRENKKKLSVREAMKQNFHGSGECHARKSRKDKLMREAKCAAAMVGMKLVPDKKDCCRKPRKCKAPTGGGSDGCGGLAECKRPKNVCEGCKPRLEVDECNRKVSQAECCQMPYRIGGQAFRNLQPDCCKMPLPKCSAECMRVRGSCVDYDYHPCCVIEAPFPAFSDCHPPFKRLIASEEMVQETNEAKARQRIERMLRGDSLRAGGATRSYCTASNPRDEEKREATTIATSPGAVAAATAKACVDKILEFFESGTDAKGLHQPVECGLCKGADNGCTCKKCMRITRNIKKVLPTEGAIGNIPEVVFNKDDILKVVDAENLISLAPKQMTRMEKVKCYLFNKASDYSAPASVDMKAPVEGFEGFVAGATAINPLKPATEAAGVGTTRKYSVSKRDPDEAAAVADEGGVEELPAARPLKAAAPVVTISESSDLFYVSEDAEHVINMRPKPGAATKVKHEFHLMHTLQPLKNRWYLPYGLTHEEYVALETQTTKNVQDGLDEMLAQLKTPIVA